MRLARSSSFHLNYGAQATSPSITTSPSRAAEQNCLSLLQSCNSPRTLHQTLAHLVKSGLQSNPLVLTKFTATCAAAGGDLTAAVSLFSTGGAAHLHDVFLFNTLIRAHADKRDSSPDSMSFFSLMLREGICPNKFTFPFLLKACAKQGSFSLGTQVHAAAAKWGFSGDQHVMNTLLHMYASSGMNAMDSARKLFNSMEKTNSVTWSAMIGGYVRSGLCNEAMALFRRMQVEGIPPDEVTLIIILSACASLGALENCRWVNSFVDKDPAIPKSLELCNAMINALAKCGDMDGALKVFETMPHRSIVSWTSIIDGFAMHGRGKEALSLYEAMRKSGGAADDVTFISILSACSHAGLVDEGFYYFNSMKDDHKMDPKIEHYGCMVDLLSRTGKVQEALDFIKSMPMAPNAIIWRTLIRGCRLHGYGGQGKSLSLKLVAEDPSQSSNYVLLSNIYAMEKQYEKKLQVRKTMSEKGIRKVPGCSVVEVEGEIYEFTAGERTHPLQREITAMAEEVTRRLRAVGYVAEIGEVMLDVDEEDKEGALGFHSERLAIAFALLRTEPGKMIRVVKNLRVCHDCHAATKLISKIYGREIVVRDRTRFHVFRDGDCSCGDFW